MSKPGKKQQKRRHHPSTMNGDARRVVLAYEGPSAQEIMYVALSQYWQKVKHKITSNLLFFPAHAEPLKTNTPMPRPLYWKDERIINFNILWGSIRFHLFVCPSFSFHLFNSLSTLSSLFLSVLCPLFSFITKEPSSSNSRVCQMAMRWSKQRFNTPNQCNICKADEE